MTDQNQDNQAQEQDTVTVRVSAPGVPATPVEFEAGSTLLDVYNQVAESTRITMEETRIVHNNTVVSSDDAGDVILETGDETDLVRETENG